MWGKLGIDQIARLNAGYTLVKFRDEVTRDLVLEAGVIHFDRKPVIVRPWTIDLADMRLVKSVPVLVRFPGLRLQYWGTKCLSALMSTIGKPILVDKVTKDRSMMQFARVLVEIEISDEVPRSIQFLNEIGQLMEQLLEFEWLPTQCKQCRIYGHTEAWCNRKQGEVWRKKERNIEGEYKQQSTDQTILSVTTGLANEAVSKDKQKKEVVRKERWDTREAQEADWITPKRMGGVKHLAPSSRNKLKNSYSVLEDKRMELNIMSVEVLQDSDQFIHAYVKELCSGREFCLTFVYGRNTIQERIQLWQDLSCLSFPFTPWLVAAELNSVFGFDDWLGGRVVSGAEMADAQRWRSMGLVDELRSIAISALELGFNPFCFFNMWTEHEGFKEFVMQSWHKSIKAHGLEGITRILDPHSADFQREERSTFETFVYQAKYYDSYLRQRSKVNWLRFGDDNTAYFHACLKQRKASNRITSFINDAGQVNEKFEDVVAHFLNHFRSIMGSHSTTSVPIQRECFIHGGNLSLDQQLRLVKPFTKKDVKDAMFSINSIKSPGPVGYCSGFFKVMWEEIGDEISDAILGIFDHGLLPNELNNENLSLIMTVENPTKVVEYRPIACCNTLYKCISKMLCGRLNKVLPLLINQNQGAFFKDRLLAHNILIFKDIIKGYKRKHISPRCVMKVDLSKAYDTIDWQILEDILTAYCFPGQFIRWVMVCLKGTSYSILMNGRIQGSFIGRKGLRQGDPISPLLFVLVMEYFTRLLIQASQSKEFRYHSNCKKLNLVSLCFADDLAEKESKNILARLQFTEGFFPLKYLGVPLRPTKCKASDCAAIIKKIHLKLHHWSSRLLSFAGRAQLIHSVLLGIRSFWMSIFLLPKSVINEIDHLCRRFLWGTSTSNENRSKVHLTTWEQVCLPKSLGGIGFKEGSKWNKVLLAKFLWVISSKQGILWVKWVDAIYLKGQSFWDYKFHSDVSWYWRKLVNLKVLITRDVLEKAVKKNKLNMRNLYVQLLNKERVRFANVVWCNLAIPKHRFILLQATMGHLLTRDNMVHCHLKLESVMCPTCDMQQEIMAICF
ncbi:uncharacterized protein LOC133796064 [Humulus lupulus]|uniref:uncharacterized protein LOC133796064 n=1 Tax=Humulus lupulus TaxID=3486 RepID=UPI002B416213|nr:uncharacterized protein LOC133796064 [Humulus lupulus]